MHIITHWHTFSKNGFVIDNDQIKDIIEKSNKYQAVFLEDVYSDETYSFPNNVQIIIIPGKSSDISGEKPDKVKIQKQTFEVSFEDSRGHS